MYRHQPRYTHTPSVNDAMRHAREGPASAHPPPPCYWSGHEEAEEGVVRRAGRPGGAPSLRAGEAAGDVPQPKSAARLRNSLRVPGVHLRLPDTGQPDFATIRIAYTPDKLCVELKSLKLYLWSFRDEGAFHEAVTNRILDDLVAAVQPRKAEVVGDFFVRGGIHTVVVARHP